METQIHVSVDDKGAVSLSMSGDIPYWSEPWINDESSKYHIPIQGRQVSRTILKGVLGRGFTVHNRHVELSGDCYSCKWQSADYCIAYSQMIHYPKSKVACPGYKDIESRTYIVFGREQDEEQIRPILMQCYWGIEGMLNSGDPLFPLRDNKLLIGDLLDRIGNRIANNRGPDVLPLVNRYLWYHGRRPLHFTYDIVMPPSNYKRTCPSCKYWNGGPQLPCAVHPLGLGEEPHCNDYEVRPQ